MQGIRAVASRMTTTLYFFAFCSALAAITIFTGGLFGYTLLAYGTDLLGTIGRNGLSSVGFPASIMPAALASTIVGVLVLFRARALPTAPFILAATASAFFIYWLYDRSLDAPWISDFQSMWNAAGQLTAQSRFSAHNIIEQRALPLLVPATYAFGHNPNVVTALNAACLVAIMLMGYDIMRRASSHRSAQIFSVLWLACAETTFALKIPSHDLWALLFSALTLWVLVSITPPTRRATLSVLFRGALVGLPILLLDVQRELGTVAIVSLATTILLVQPRTHRPDSDSEPQLRRTLVVMLAGAIFSFGLGKIILERTGIVTSDPAYTYLSKVRTAALAPSYSDGTYRYARGFESSLLRLQSPEAQAETAQALLFSDFVDQPGLRVSSILWKMGGLSALGSQTYFYQSGLAQTDPALSTKLTSYNKFYSALFSALLLASLACTLSRLESLATVYAVAFMGVLIGGLVTIGEVQPRYLFPVWFFGLLPISARLGSLHSVRGAPQAWGLGLLCTVLMGCVVIALTVWSSSVILGRTYTVADGRVLTDFQYTSIGVQSADRAPPLQLDRIAGNGRSLGIGELGFSLAAAGTTPGQSSISASRHLCFDEPRTTLRFAYAAPNHDTNVRDTLELKVEFNEREIFHTSLPTDGNIRDISIPAAATPGECGNIVFRLIIQKPIQNAGWAKTTTTEIYFPRLSRH